MLLTNSPEVVPVSDLVLNTVPLVVNESQINPFKFYWSQALRPGMQYNQELYGLIQEMGGNARLEAYRLGCDLLVQGLPIMLTASSKRYAIWLNLRQSSAPHHRFLK